MLFKKNYLHKIFFFFIFSLVGISNLRAQINDDTFKKDKENAIKKLDNFPLPDSNRINALRDIVVLPAFFLKQKKEIKPYCDELVILSKKLNDKVALGNAYEVHSFFFKSSKEYDKAIAYLDSAILLANNTTDKQLIARRNRALKLKGVIYNTLENYTSALNCSFEALAYYENINSIAKSDIYALVGNIYYVLKNYEKAIYYNKKYAENSFVQISPDNKFTAYSQLVKVLIASNDLSSTEIYFSKQKVLINEVDSFYRGSFYRNYGLFYLKKQQYDSSYLYFKKALLAEEEFPHSTPVNEIQGYISYVLLQLNNLSDAKKYIDLNLQSSNATKEKENQITALKNASKYFEKRKDFISAHKFLSDAVQLNDKLFEENAVKQNNAFATIYETEKVQRDALRSQTEFTKKEDSLKLVQANTDAALKQQSFLNKEQQQNLIIKDKELLLNKQTLFSNNQQLSLLSKDKELQHLAYLKTQADLQTEQLLKTENEKQLTIVQKEK